MKNTHIALAAAALTIATGLSQAEEAEPEQNWSAAAEFGLIATNGNTKTSTMNAKLAGDIKQNQWTHSGSVESNISEDDDATTAEKYVVAAKTQYDIGEHNYMFLGLTYEDDRFSGFDFQVTATGGYGRRILKDTKRTLDVEIGPGYRHVNPVVGDDEGEAVLHLGGKFKYKISKTSNFSQELFTDIGEENTVSQSISALTAKISDQFAMKTTFAAKHTDEVPADVEDLDTKTTITLVYSF